MFRHRGRMFTMSPTTHVPPLHFFEVGDQLFILATIKGGRVVPDAFGPKERIR